MNAAHPLLGGAVLIALSWLMLAAGAAKLRDRAAHARALDDYALLPAGTGRWLAPLLGACECALAALLYLPCARAGAAAAVLTLLVLYTAAVALNLLRGRRDIDCGCGGALHAVPLGGGLLARNAVLVLGALLLALSPGAMPRGALEWLAALGIAALLALIYNAAVFLLARDSLPGDD